MIQCEQCEFCNAGPDGHKVFTCDPFSNVKEPECVAKWQLMRLDMLLATYQDMVRWYGRLAPLQDKIFKYVQREISDIDESEQWKADHEEGQDGEPGSTDDWPV
jgi:hypothetical protein